MLLEIALLFIFLHPLPKHQAFDWVFGLCVGTTDNITIITSGFILIVLLRLYYSGRIVDYIAFDYSNRIANYIVCIVLAVSLIVLLLIVLPILLIVLLWPLILLDVFMLRSIFYFWYHFHWPQNINGLRHNLLHL